MAVQFGSTASTTTTKYGDTAYLALNFKKTVMVNVELKNALLVNLLQYARAELYANFKSEHLSFVTF